MSDVRVLPSRLREHAHMLDSLPMRFNVWASSMAKDMRDAASALEAHDAEFKSVATKLVESERERIENWPTCAEHEGYAVPLESDCVGCELQRAEKAEAQLAAHDAVIATVRRERDAAHAHACELVLEAKDRDAVIATLRALVQDWRAKAKLYDPDGYDDSACLDKCADEVERALAGQPDADREDTTPCSNCGCEERDHRGILTCRCPDGPADREARTGAQETD